MGASRISKLWLVVLAMIVGGMPEPQTMGSMAREKAAARKNATVNRPNWPLEILTWDRTRAYPGTVYDFRLGVKGGVFPYTFSLAKNPSGMTIHPGKGTLLWEVPNRIIEAHEVEVVIVDSEGSTLRHRFEVEVTRKGFFFVAADGEDDDTADGSIDNPWKTPAFANDEARNHLLTDIIYIKTGTYPMKLSIYSRKRSPLIWMAWPGDKVILEGDGVSRAMIGLRTEANDKALFQGLEFRNSGAKMFWVSGKTSNVIWRKNVMHGIKSTGRTNPSFIFCSDGGGRPIEGKVLYNRLVVQENVFYDLTNDKGHGGSVVLYDVMNFLFEENESYDIAGNSVVDKDDGYYNTIRNNILHDAKAGIILANQYTQGQVEVSYNLIYDIGIKRNGKRSGGNPIVIGVQPGYIQDIFVHHNTVVDGPIRFRWVLADSRSANINIYNNIIRNENGWVYTAKSVVEEAIFSDKVNIDNNLVWTSGQRFFGYGRGAQKRSFEEWQAEGKDKHGEFKDPELDKDNRLPKKSLYLGRYGRDLPGISLDSSPQGSRDP